MSGPALALLATLLQSVSAPTAASPPPVAQWPDLPELAFRRRQPVTPELSAYARREVAAGRCSTATPGSLKLDLAVLIDGGGVVRRITPRAIRCPTVEQFGAGLLLRMASNNLAGRPVGWRRTSIVFSWQP